MASHKQPIKSARKDSDPQLNWPEQLYVNKLVNPRMLKVILLTFVLKGGKTIPRCISASRLARNKNPTATPSFWGQTFQWCYQ